MQQAHRLSYRSLIHETISDEFVQNTWDKSLIGIPSSRERRFSCSRTDSERRMLTFRVFRMRSKTLSILSRCFLRPGDRNQQIFRSLVRICQALFSSIFCPYLLWNLRLGNASFSTQYYCLHQTRTGTAWMYPFTGSINRLWPGRFGCFTMSIYFLSKMSKCDFFKRNSSIFLSFLSFSSSQMIFISQFTTIRIHCQYVAAP